LKRKDSEPLAKIIPPARIHLIKVQPEVGTYKAYTKENSEISCKNPLPFLKDDMLHYNRRLMNSFKIDYAKQMSSERINDRTSISMQKKRTSSMGIIDTSAAVSNGEKVDKLINRKRRIPKRTASNLVEAYRHLPHINANL
jgi:hypothetical protein